ncbi:diguanylate cyclase [Pyruvatibacter mobilis]|uniref:Diguanylate cyclase n=1 Tax=Pyruvatibacter mobilis TaxID=1712261 RepID=A0A845Q8S3_9HYPH|nr:sensor domain-containing diguanylate cyclase [Pyruvatibacter mobilis]NBG94837.1 diguanylate cyclase [Pyruvatibacter mobilis]QJD76058.1 diguanylate cyclase [Pyruvatibacter mobilis]GGD20786.1 hypothetical protein GCM10011587_26740 [Pyruvatibacter mobilis]
MRKAASVSQIIKRHLVRMSVLGSVLCAGLLYMAYELSVAESRWGEAASLHDARPAAISRLRHELGYGGLVHHYLNTILRPEEASTQQVAFGIGGVESALKEFGALDISPLERTAIEIIREELEQFNLALRALEEGEFTSMSPERTYIRLGVTPDRMARAVETLAMVSGPREGDRQDGQHLLGAFEAAIGLNGLIHHLKVYVLTSDPAALDAATAALERAQATLAVLKARAMTGTEREAVRIIGRTIDDYARGLTIAAEMVAEGVPAREIDKAIRVDDVPALSAYETLRGFAIARLNERTREVGAGLVTVRWLALVLIVVFLVPFVLQFARVCLGLMKAVPSWLDQVTDIADSLAKEEFDRNQDYSGLPAEFAALETPFNAIRRTLWFRREQAVEGEAQVDSFAAENDQLSGKLATVRKDLDEMTARAESAEARAASAGTSVDMIGGVIESLSQGVLATHGFGKLMFWNPRLAELTGVPLGWFTRERTLKELILYLATRGDYGVGDPTQIADRVIKTIDRELGDGVYRYDQSFGGQFVLALEIVRRGDGTIVFSATDITERHEQAAIMREQATSDPLTGLANRNALDKFTGSMFRHVERSGKVAAVLALDLDGFKPVNDAYGHGAGDEVLVELSARLREEVRDTDFVARTGGDEFIIVMLHLEDIRGAVRFAQRLLRAIEVPIRLSQGVEVSISGSIGVSAFPQDAREVDELFRKADEALYEAKGAGRNCVRAYGDLNAVKDGQDAVEGGKDETSSGLRVAGSSR